MIFLGADHNGFELKRSLLAFFLAHHIPVTDVTTKRTQRGDDYPRIAYSVAHAMRRHPDAFGILMCGSGNGMAIAANRAPHIRAALASEPRYARKAREDEHANVLVLPAWWLTRGAALRVVRAWLRAKPSHARRHLRRIRSLTLKRP